MTQQQHRRPGATAPVPDPVLDPVLADELGALALSAARAGARAIAGELAAGALDVAEKTAAHDLVTNADRAAEAAVLAHLGAARPDDAVLGEETGAHAGTSGVRWIVDPLDGTMNAVHGRADHAVAVAAEVGGTPVVAAVLRPADGRWIATRSSGVRHGGAGDDRGAPVGPLTERPLSSTMIAFGLPGVMADRQRVLHLVAELAPRIAAIRLIGSAACDALGLVVGELDATVHVGLQEWDVAVGQAAVTAAGGTWRNVPIGGGLTALVSGSHATVDALEAALGEVVPAAGRG